jgi:hypothetical protein
MVVDVTLILKNIKNCLPSNGKPIFSERAHPNLNAFLKMLSLECLLYLSICAATPFNEYSIEYCQNENKLSRFANKTDKTQYTIHKKRDTRQTSRVTP